jgi:hypothetical protein
MSAGGQTRLMEKADHYVHAYTKSERRTSMETSQEILHNSSLGFVTRSTINNRASEEALKTWGMIRPTDVGYKITPAGRELLKLKKKSGN